MYITRLQYRNTFVLSITSLQVESRRTELLIHPIVYSLIGHKWRVNFVAAFFYLSLICYVVFAIFLTTFALRLPNPLSPICV